MFTFNFNNDSAPAEPEQAVQTAPCEAHDFKDLIERAPRISFSTFPVPNHQGIPRRDLYDVKYELMGQDNLTEDDQLLLSTEDVRKTVYEGGLKVWEGTGDLVTVLAGSDQVPSSVLELGCGAGIPACWLLYQAIKSGSKGRFVFADYNYSVLRLLTMPNVVLAWLSAAKDIETKGEINLTSDLVSECVSDLQARGIEVKFISGGWSPEFSKLVGQFELVLASETIYSLESLPAFTDVLQRSLGPGGRALVAAKKVYFGVGGGVIEFKRMLDHRKMIYETILEQGNVGRVVLSIVSPAAQS